jgi:hypothetical protein
MGQMMSNLGNSNVTDTRQARPQDLDSSEMGARVLAQGTRGLAQGFQNYQGQNSQMRQGGGGAMQMPGTPPPVDPSYFMPKGNNLAFYGGS